MDIDTNSVGTSIACALCGGPVRRGRASLTFERASVQVIVENVPVLICAECDEQYVPGPVALALSDDVEAALDWLETRDTHAGAVTHPRSLVMQASEQTDLALAV
jgi:YgiT-type zinc finger domain-containing protein